MNITDYGPPIVLLAGVGLLGSAVRHSFLADRLKQMTGLLVTGTLLVGTSVWGLQFIGEYSEFLKASGLISDLISSPSEQSYGEALESVADESVPGSLAELISSYIAQNPIEGVEKLLDTQIDRARSDGADRLRSVRDALQVSELEAERTAQIAQRDPQRAQRELQQLDPAQKFYLGEKLGSLSDQQLGELGVDRQKLELWRQPIKR